MADKSRGKEKKPRQPAELTYWQETRQPLTSLAFVLPMLLFYEIGIVLVNGPIVATHGYEVRISSDVLLRQVLAELFSRIGLGAIVMSGMLVVAALLVWQIASRRPWTLKPWILAAMLGESLLLALLFCFVVKVFIDPLISMTIENDRLPFLESRVFLDTVMAFGAGVYEEFVFRLVLIGLFALVVHGLTGAGWKVGTFAGIVLAAVAFSAVHYVGLVGRDFTWLSFVGRTGAGLFFGTVYYYRGFGVAAGTHAVYDVFFTLFFAGPGGS
jgi:membrane protease YdiL (CAAX protease family)